MQRLREDGGIKFINIKHKSEVPKIDWLIKLVIDDSLVHQKVVASTLVGTQTSGLSLLDIIFTDQDYVKKFFTSELFFYSEALNAITKLRVWKKIS